MPEHSSLAAKVVFPEPVVALAHMAPYVPCWCGSGKKYKFCHFRRDQEKPANLFEDQSDIAKLIKSSGYCSYPDHTSCSNDIIKSHSVQRNGGLAAIAENGHVLTVKPDLRGMINNNGNPPPKKVGLSNASVFPGFCEFHDNSLFKPIEGASISLDKSTAFLFAYRAVSYERFHKMIQLKTCENQRLADRGQPLWKQEIIQNHLNPYEWGVKRGMRDIDGWKQAYDNSIVNADTSSFHHYAIRLDVLLPLVVCCYFHVETDVAGTRLQKLGTDEIYEGISLTVTAFNGTTIAVFGWMGDLNGPSAKFVDAFKALPDDRKADALLRMAFYESDNLFMRESWWSALSDGARSFLQGAVQSGTPQKARRQGDLVDNGESFVTGKVIEATSS